MLTTSPPPRLHQNLACENLSEATNAERPSKCKMSAREASRLFAWVHKWHGSGGAELFFCFCARLSVVFCLLMGYRRWCMFAHSSAVLRPSSAGECQDALAFDLAAAPAAVVLDFFKFEFKPQRCGDFKPECRAFLA